MSFIMSVKQKSYTVREGQAYIDTDGDVKVDNGENVPQVKTEHFVQDENSALPNISQKQCIQLQVRTLDIHGQEDCCEKPDLQQEKETNAMPGYYHCVNSNFTKSQVMSVQVKEEFTQHNTQMALKSELHPSTDSDFDTKVYYMSQDVDEYLPTSDDVFKNQQDLVKVYRCHTCQYSSNYLIDLYQHIISHGMETVYICDLCQSSYQYFLDLKCHLASHTAECKNLAQSFHGRKENFREYLTSEKVEQTSENYYPQNKLECELKWQNDSHAGDGTSVINDNSKCQSENLRDSSTRENAYLYSCDLCKYICRHLCYLKEHYKCRHPGEKPLFSCEVCSYTCATPCQLERHKRRHTGEKPYSCDLCSFTSARAHDLKRHKRLHTGERPYSCDLCNYSCPTASNLKQHKKCHTGEKPYSCDLCSYTCARGWQLKKHKRRHTGEKPYSCDLCSHTCATASDLRRHKRCHTGERPYSCDLCSYTCARASNLKQHKKRHTGEKPYSCDLCSYTCARASNLKIHKRLHTGEKPYSCDMCSYACATGSRLNSHKRLVHTYEKGYVAMGLLDSISQKVGTASTDL